MRFIILISLISIFVNQSCNDGGPFERWYTIKINNTQNYDIYFAGGTPRFGMNVYPDTTIPLNKPSLLIVRANDWNNFNSSVKWETVISNLISDTLSIYVFNADTINAYDWSKIKAEYKVLKRYDLSEQDLEKTNWTITYP